MKLLDVIPVPDSVWSVITIQSLAGTRMVFYELVYHVVDLTSLEN